MAARRRRRAVTVTVLFSDSFKSNISPRARWVVCPLGRRTRGHGRRVIYMVQKRRFNVVIAVSPLRPRGHYHAGR